MKKAFKGWLIILLSLLDDVAIALLILLGLWLFGLTITLPVIIFTALLFVIYALTMHKLIIPVLRKKVTTGAEGMVGLEGEVIASLTPDGLVRIKGERWQAKSISGYVNAGQKVEVVAVCGLVLRVKSKDNTAKF